MCIGVCLLALTRRVRGPMTRYARESATAAWLVMVVVVVIVEVATTATAAAAAAAAAAIVVCACASSSCWEFSVCTARPSSENQYQTALISWP